jgi:hypothetical protein
MTDTSSFLMSFLPLWLTDYKQAQARVADLDRDQVAQALLAVAQAAFGSDDNLVALPAAVGSARCGSEEGLDLVALLAGGHLVSVPNVRMTPRELLDLCVAVDLPNSARICAENLDWAAVSPGSLFSERRTLPEVPADDAQRVIYGLYAQSCLRNDAESFFHTSMAISRHLGDGDIDMWEEAEWAAAQVLLWSLTVGQRGRETHEEAWTFNLESLDIDIDEDNLAGRNLYNEVLLAAKTGLPIDPDFFAGRINVRWDVIRVIAEGARIDESLKLFDMYAALPPEEPQPLDTRSTEKYRPD